ncbi:agamous-like MADS-box protein AGL80 [Salvia hispanica]|uniref:agamous-like MADS-box protein AGL80 n=1 Tax=Salvia hispanica TaxID=49212 RepID=UPI002009A849|nr:agamous-like MADS-box protein AGL80 [Salvia hispanica]
MELVKKEKARLAALKMRKGGLVKKIEQLTTLCDVPACMIIHDPSTNSSFIWPDDFAQVRRLIDSYKPNPTADFFKGRQKELAKTKYDDSLDLMDESQLLELGQAVRSRIDFLSMVKKEIDVVLDLDEFEHIDQDDIFSAADDVMVKEEKDVLIDLDEIEEIDQDHIFSAADDVMAAMVKEENDVFIDLDEIEAIDQDAIFSATSANTQLPVPDYYCPLPLNQPTPFMDHNYLDYANENVNWCADQNLNCSSVDVNWFAGDGGGVLASYLWHLMLLLIVYPHFLFSFLLWIFATSEFCQLNCIWLS